MEITNPLSGNNAELLPALTIRDGAVIADSRDVAAKFGKEHRRVLQTIRELECSDEFRLHHFVPFKIKDLPAPRRLNFQPFKFEDLEG